MFEALLYFLGILVLGFMLETMKIWTSIESVSYFQVFLI